MKILSKKCLVSPRFVAEGAAIFEDDRVAVIADVHLGHEWARAGSGEMMIEHSFQETTEKLKRMFARAAVETLIVAGDLVEKRFPCAGPRTTWNVCAIGSPIAGSSSSLCEGTTIRVPFEPVAARRST